MSTGEGLGMGWSTPPDSEWIPEVEDVHHRSRRYRPGQPDEVSFPVAPMLDMAFQLLAFFILTFKGPSAETHVELDLPATPAALPAAMQGQSRTKLPKRFDLENDLVIRAEADELGELTSVRLGEASMNDLAALGERLRRYTRMVALEGQPLRVRLVADERLRYEPAAQIIATCSAAGVASIRLTPPGAATGPTPELPSP